MIIILFNFILVVTNQDKFVCYCQYESRIYAFHLHFLAFRSEKTLIPKYKFNCNYTSSEWLRISLKLKG